MAWTITAHTRTGKQLVHGDTPSMAVFAIDIAREIAVSGITVFDSPKYIHTLPRDIRYIELTGSDD